MGSLASDLVLSESESPGQHMNSPSQADNSDYTEITIGEVLAYSSSFCHEVD